MDRIQIRENVRVKVECLRRDPSFSFESEYLRDRRDGDGLCAISALYSGGIYVSAGDAAGHDGDNWSCRSTQRCWWRWLW